MAATDQTLRNQRTLDIVFAVSSVLMLLSIVWMFAQDYYRPYKAEQRVFRDVEVAVAQRAAVNAIPAEKELEAAEEKVAAAKKAVDEESAKLSAARQELAALLPKRDSADAAYQGIKANLESITSFYYIEVEQAGTKDAPAAREHLARIQQLEPELAEAQARRDEIQEQVKKHQREIDRIEGPLNAALSNLKKVNDRFDTQVKLATKKQWTVYDTVRGLPILDAFASPTKIQQVTNNDIPIDYNFKHVTRFDRCATCHLGIDRPAYTRERLQAIAGIDEDQAAKLAEARSVVQKRRDKLAGLPEQANVPTPDQLALPTVSLSGPRVSQFAAHPRLDLFVGSNSKHPAETFGCSSCHYGQGSGTEFGHAAHTPNSYPDKHRWVKEHGWEHNHMWDFPMLPQRFVESSCIKCHYEVTDLISTENREEAPKLLRGYRLIRENGCFGCHEISGQKGGRQVGPDLRLEPTPPLSDLPALERARVEGDTDNPPGHLRKVGPSLYRLVEKTNPDWMVKWLALPRGFRPDTKMPHFYNVSNNAPEVLPPEQKKFPDVEIHSIAHFLTEVSKSYVRQIEKTRKEDTPEARSKDETRAEALLARGLDRLKKEEREEYDQIRLRNKLRKEKVLEDLTPKGYTAVKERGRVLFTERGCLSCHVHQGTEKDQAASKDAGASPALVSEALFGPNLSQLAEKLGRKQGDTESARRWLIQWIMEPQVHSPRSRMPVTHLTPEDAADVAAWLLSQEAMDLGPEWPDLRPAEPTLEDLKKLAEVYLVRLMSRRDMDKFLRGTLEKELISGLNSDERELAHEVNADTLKFYLGKKAVSRQGCYACHDIPGFDNARGIGVGLNDWGKKDAEKLAFEDIANYLRDHFYPVDTLVNSSGEPYGPKEDHGHLKRPYEKFYLDRLQPHHGSRMGYLHQKLLDPRSYDYNRLRAWDDRLRMPEFRFARARQKQGEDVAAFQARAWKEEADAREAVMTFVLGLVAEPVPPKSINQPKGDRLAEVQGRKILEKYNCNGCHLIRPGVFDFPVNSITLPKLLEAHTNSEKAIKDGDYRFYEHRGWTGKMPSAPDQVTLETYKPELIEDDQKYARLRLATAARFLDLDQGVRDIANSTDVFLPLSVLGLDEKEINTQADLEQAIAQRYVYGGRTFGGTFADLLKGYLRKKDSKLYDDDGKAGASAPPSLVGQGERTQPDWLYQFLLEPTKVRQMAVLRMPKFNMSKEEARALVDYFAGVERLTNPGLQLSPLEVYPQRDELNGPYWTQRNREYFEQLQKNKPALEARVALNQKLWQQMQKDAEAALEKDLRQVKDDRAELSKQLTAKQEALKEAKEGKEKTSLTAEVARLEESIKSSEARTKELEKQQADLTPEQMQKVWEREQAYSSDAWRLVNNRQLCLQCHQIGSAEASNKQTPGPVLDLAHRRLRPDWVYRWVASPKHFTPYTPPMPPYFPTTKKDFQQFLVGSSPQQIEAVRDVLLNYPRLSTLPINRAWRADMADQKK